jgi:hypothetical protein
MKDCLNCGQRFNEEKGVVVVGWRYFCTNECQLEYFNKGGR